MSSIHAPPHGVPELYAFGASLVDLEREYNLRQAFPDYAQYFEDWRERSAAARARLDCELDVAYGPKPRQKIDRFSVPGASAPLLVFIHGGYWRSMDKSDFSFLAE